MQPVVLLRLTWGAPAWSCSSKQKVWYRWKYASTLTTRIHTITVSWPPCGQGYAVRWRFVCPHVRSPSPEPIYNNEGKRLNTREYRTRKQLEEERHQMVQKASAYNSDYKPPPDYKWVDHVVNHCLPVLWWSCCTAFTVNPRFFKPYTIIDVEVRCCVRTVFGSYLQRWFYFVL